MIIDAVEMCDIYPHLFVTYRSSSYQRCCNLLMDAYQGAVACKLAKVWQLRGLTIRQPTEQQHSWLGLGLG